jgi:hypothetical protein
MEITKKSVLGAAISIYLSQKIMVGSSGRYLCFLQLLTVDDINNSWCCGGLSQSSQTYKDDEIFSPALYVVHINCLTVKYNTFTGGVPMLTRICNKTTRMIKNTSAVYI